MFYESLLTDKQHDIAYDYYIDDISMGEIADNYGISKAAVSDQIKRVNELLAHYEEKLGLRRKYLLRKNVYEQALAYNDSRITNIIASLIDIDEMK